MFIIQQIRPFTYIWPGHPYHAPCLVDIPFLSKTEQGVWYLMLGPFEQINCQYIGTVTIFLIKVKWPGFSETVPKANWRFFLID